MYGRLHVSAALYAYRGGGTSFDRGKNGVGGIEAAYFSAHFRDRLCDGVGDEIRKHAAQVAEDDRWPVGRLYAAAFSARPAGEKIADELCGGGVVFAVIVCRLLKPFLKFHAAEKTPAEILRLDSDEQTAVYVLAVTRVTAHAVGDNAAFFG